MSVFRRMRDITAATLNEMLEDSGDPVRIIDQYLTETRTKIAECEELYRKYTAHAGGLRKQYLEAEAFVNRREDQAMLALKAGEDEVARMALQEKMGAEEKSVRYKKMYDESKYALIELEDQLNEIKTDYQEALDKRHLYVARMETARLQNKMNQMRRNPGFESKTFRRLEDQVSDMEWEARALRDVRRLGRDTFEYAGQQVNSVMKQVQSQLDQELSKLKQKLDEERGNA